MAIFQPLIKALIINARRSRGRYVTRAAERLLPTETRLFLGLFIRLSTAGDKFYYIYWIDRSRCVSISRRRCCTRTINKIVSQYLLFGLKRKKKKKRCTRKSPPRIWMNIGMQERRGRRRKSRTLRGGSRCGDKNLRRDDLRNDDTEPPSSPPLSPTERADDNRFAGVNY